MGDDICNSCDNGCTDDERKQIEEAIGALGVLVAYIHGFGFIVVILASITMCLTCCMCCPCCGPLKQAQTDVQTMQPQAQVMGQVVQPAEAGKASWVRSRANSSKDVWRCRADCRGLYC